MPDISHSPVVPVSSVLPPETQLYTNRATANLVIYDDAVRNPLSQLDFSGDGEWESLIIDERMP